MAPGEALASSRAFWIGEVKSPILRCPIAGQRLACKGRAAQPPRLHCNLNQGADSRRMRPAPHRDQADLAPELRLDQWNGNDGRMQCRVPRHEGVSQPRCRHRKHPVVTIAAVDGFSLDPELVEHLVSQYAEFAIDALEVRLAVELDHLDLLLLCQSVGRI